MSDTEFPSKNDLSKTQRECIDTHAEFILEELPDPQIPFDISAHTEYPPYFGENPDLKNMFNKLRLDECILKLPDKRSDGLDTPVGIYILPPIVAAIAQQALEDGFTPCNCGHRGIRNLRHKSGLTCTYQACNQVTLKQNVHTADPTTTVTDSHPPNPPNNE